MINMLFPQVSHFISIISFIFSPVYYCHIFNTADNIDIVQSRHFFKYTLCKSMMVFSGILSSFLNIKSQNSFFILYALSFNISINDILSSLFISHLQHIQWTLYILYLLRRDLCISSFHILNYIYFYSFS